MIDISWDSISMLAEFVGEEGFIQKRITISDQNLKEG